MSNFSIVVDDKLVKEAFKKAPEKTKEMMKLSLKQGALEIQNEAKILAPKKTGDLRRSITHKVHGWEWAEVGTDKVYARIQEYGGKTWRGGTIKPRLYFTGAVEKKTEIIVKNFKDNLTDII